MSFNLTTVLEKRLKVLPNKATVGVQVMMHESRFESKQKPQRRHSCFIPAELSVTSTHRDAKIGTEPVKPGQTESSTTKSLNQSLRYRLKGVMAEENIEIESINETNKVLRVELLKARKHLLHQMMSYNERPPGTPRSFRFQPISIPSPVQKTTKKPKSPSPLSESVNFISHNKQTLFNIKTSSPRPVSDKFWVKTMRKTAILQKHGSFDLTTCEAEVQNKDFSNSEWKKRPQTGVSINLLDFSDFTGEVMVNPSYAYCGSCRKGTAPISLRGKDMRPRATFTKTFE